MAARLIFGLLEIALNEFDADSIRSVSLRADRQEDHVRIRSRSGTTFDSPEVEEIGLELNRLLHPWFSALAPEQWTI